MSRDSSLLTFCTLGCLSLETLAGSRPSELMFDNGDVLARFKGAVVDRFARDRADSDGSGAFDIGFLGSYVGVLRSYIGVLRSCLSPLASQPAFSLNFLGSASALLVYSAAEYTLASRGSASARGGRLELCCSVLTLASYAADCWG